MYRLLLFGRKVTLNDADEFLPCRHPYVDGTRTANSLKPGIFRTSVHKKPICSRYESWSVVGRVAIVGKTFIHSLVDV